LSLPIVLPVIKVTDPDLYIDVVADVVGEQDDAQLVMAINPERINPIFVKLCFII
jgi:hypothetical protein|tara:strand:+ start:24053 stop:24217 length:165 start_codon:yes stop_codon:yes gene_type:complete